MSNLCEVHKQEWKQSHFSEQNCEICKLKKENEELKERIFHFEEETEDEEIEKLKIVNKELKSKIAVQKEIEKLKGQKCETQPTQLFSSDLFKQFSIYDLHGKTGRLLFGIDSIEGGEKTVVTIFETQDSKCHILYTEHFSLSSTLDHKKISENFKEGSL